LVEELHGQQEVSDAHHAEVRATCNRLLPEYSNKRDYHADQRDIATKIVKDTKALLSEAQTNL